VCAPPPPLPPAGPWPLPWPWQGRQAWLVFCHLIHIITGVTPFDGGGELIALVTVLSASVSPSPGILRCLSPFPLQPYIRSPRQSRSRSSATTPERNHISAALWLLRPVPMRAWSSGRAGASGTLARLRTLHRVCGD
jgi:hypothetical protein